MAFSFAVGVGIGALSLPFCFLSSAGNYTPASLGVSLVSSAISLLHLQAERTTLEHAALGCGYLAPIVAANFGGECFMLMLATSWKGHYSFSRGTAAAWSRIGAMSLPLGPALLIECLAILNKQLSQP